MIFKRKEAKRIKHELVKDYVKGNTLDIGYGAYPSPIANDFYGLDIQKREAPSGYKEVRSADLNCESIPYEDSFFDTVMAFDILEHLMNPQGFFLEVNRILKKDGRLIFCIPNPYFWREILLNIFPNKFIKKGEVPPQEAHINLPSRHTVRTMFYWSGFELEKELGASFPIPKTNLVLGAKKFPALAYEIIYIAKKTADNPRFSVITKRTDGVWEFLKK